MKHIAEKFLNLIYLELDVSGAASLLGADFPVALQPQVPHSNIVRQGSTSIRRLPSCSVSSNLTRDLLLGEFSEHGPFRFMGGFSTEIQSRFFLNNQYRYINIQKTNYTINLYLSMATFSGLSKWIK